MSGSTSLPAHARRLLLGVLATGLLAAAGALVFAASPAHAAGTATASAASQARAARAVRTHKVHRGLAVALRQIGDPYSRGSAGPNRFDCSGLLYYSLRHAGFGGVPRTSSAQSQWGRPVSKRNMRRGDMIFFHHGGHVYHAAIFLRWSKGRALILHSPRTGDHVRKERVWTSQWFARTLR